MLGFLTEAINVPKSNDTVMKILLVFHFFFFKCQYRSVSMIDDVFDFTLI